MLGKLTSFCRGFSQTPLATSLFKSKKPWSGSQVALLLPKENQNAGRIQSALTREFHMIPKNAGKIQNIVTRKFHMIPKSQYDSPELWFFNPFHMLIKHWELAPLFILIIGHTIVVFIFIIYSCFNKTDLNFRPGHRTEIARTMNLRCPTIHKLMVIEPSVYRPWPEMQDVLDAMAKAEIQIALLDRIEANKGKGGAGGDPCSKGAGADDKKKGGMC